MLANLHIRGLLNALHIDSVKSCSSARAVAAVSVTKSIDEVPTKHWKNDGRFDEYSNARSNDGGRKKECSYVDCSSTRRSRRLLVEGSCLLKLRLRVQLPLSELVLLTVMWSGWKLTQQQGLVDIISTWKNDPAYIYSMYSCPIPWDGVVWWVSSWVCYIYIK